MADTFKSEFVMSDALILLNLHNAAYKKMKPVKNETIEISSGKAVAKIDCHQVHDKIGDVTNSGCKNGLKAPEKDTFKSPTNIYEVGIVLRVGAKEGGRQDSAVDPRGYDDKKLKEIEKELQKIALTPIRSYMVVFVGKDAGNKIKDGDIQVVHYETADKAAVVNSDFTIGSKKREDKEFGFALCKIRYSIGLEKK